MDSASRATRKSKASTSDPSQQRNEKRMDSASPPEIESAHLKAPRSGGPEPPRRIRRGRSPATDYKADRKSSVPPGMRSEAGSGAASKMP